MTLGFIGLGNIGRPMARRLASSGTRLFVHDTDPAACAALADVAEPAGSISAIGETCSHIAICVRNDAEVRNVVEGAGGLLPALKSRTRTVIAIHSTIGLDTLLDLAAKAAAAGAELVDAAVTGGADIAARGTLTAMIGGEPGIADRVRPLMSAYASNIIHAGPLGSGMKLKVANNLVTYTQLAVAVEAMRLVRVSGADPQQLVAVMRANGNLTPAMDAYLKARADGAAKGNMLELLNFQKGLASLAEKDLDHALATAAASGVSTPIGAQIRALFRATVERIES